MVFDVIKSKIKDGVYWIILNRPEKLNAINLEMWNKLRVELNKGAENPDIRAIVITGSGRFFCAGEDIRDLDSIKNFEDAVRIFLDYIRPTFELILKNPKPVISAVNGPAYGVGVELVLASDLAVANKEAYFSLSQGRIGVGPAIALIIGLPILGRKRLLEMVLLGRKVFADEAVNWGLINKVAYKDLEDEVSEMVKDLSKTTPLLTRMIKDVMLRQFNIIDYTSIFREVALYSLSEETRSGIKQFLERKKS